VPKDEPAASPGGLPDLERTTVTLPWGAFKELLQPADAVKPPEPPRPAVVKRLALQGQVQDRQVTFTGTFEIAVLADGWVTVPLLPSGEVALRAARIDKKETSLALTDDGYALCIQGKGTYVAALDFAVALEEDDTGFELPLIEVPVTVLELVLPQAHQEITVGEALAVRTDHTKSATKVACALGPQSSVRIDWQDLDRAPEARVLPLVSAEVATAVTIADRVLTLQAHVALSIQKSTIASVSVRVPEGVNLLAAEGDAVRDWELVGKPGDAGGRLARIRFQYDLKGDHALKLRAELALKDAEVAQVPALILLWDRAAAQAEVDGKPAPAPAPPPEPIERQRGVLALCAEPRSELKLGKTQNLVPMDVKELPRTVPPLPHPALFALRFARVPWALAVNVVAHDDVPVLVATVDHAHLEVLALEDGRVLCKALLNIRNNSRQFLKVRLPPGASLWSSFRSNRPVKPAADAEGVIRVPLVKSGENAPFTVELSYLLTNPPYGTGGARELILPRFDLPTSYYSLQLYLPRRYRHFNFDGSLKRVEHLSRGHVYLASPEDAGLFAASNTMQSQSVAPPVGASSEGGNAGQLPIRIPMLRRGLEARFERTLVVDEPMSLKWECKRRKSDGA
jgi:hypothetical protein